MRILLFISLILSACFLQAQTNNKLHDPNFWKGNPSLQEVQKAISQGNSPSDMNAMDFDAVSQDINNNASTEVIIWLLQQEGNPVTKTTNHMRTYLHWATARGNAAVVKHLLEKGSDVNAPDSHGDSPLQFAASFGMNQPAIYDLYQKAGVDLKQRNKKGATYMMLGIPYDTTLTLTNYLANKGLLLTDTDNSGATLFDYAARTGNISTMKTLLAKGVKATGKALLMAAQGTRRAANGTAPAAANRPAPSPASVVTSVVASANRPTPTPANLPQITPSDDFTEKMKLLISNGLDIARPMADKSTLYHIAAQKEDIELFRKLERLAININAKNQEEMTVLHKIALTAHNDKLLKYLIEKGADKNATTEFGETAYELAAANEYLLNNNINIEFLK